MQAVFIFIIHLRLFRIIKNNKCEKSIPFFWLLPFLQ